jgi:hypothetical protein
MPDVSLENYPKLFKFSLAAFFSEHNSQELPVSDFQPLSLFPKRILDRILLHIKKSKKKRWTFLWNLLQCKDLASKVPKSMIIGAYEKHAEKLTTVGVTPEPLLNRFRIYMLELLEEFDKIYPKVNSSIPPSNACVENPRSKGGVRSFLRDSLNFQGFKRRPPTKLDPVVIHLTGPPGVGKSYLTNRISLKLSREFGLVKDVYARSIATDFWDGYRQQLIVTMDDMFSEADDLTDHRQLLQICSPVPTILNMAKLEEKGREFKSEFLILSSNNPHVYGRSATNPEALERRIYPAYEIISKTNGVYRISILKSSKHGLSITEDKPPVIMSLSEDKLVDLIVSDALVKFDERFEANESCITQMINRASFGEPGLSVSFPKCPTTLPVVKACAIPEPLKVRMITKGEGNNFILKPVQKALWKSLQSFPVFSLTSCPDIDISTLNLQHLSNYLLSGDYESATDLIHMDIMKIAGEMIASHVPKNIGEYVIRESGPHIIEYPKETGIPNIVQTNGQLMGSLLSFPILCIANAVTIGHALDCYSMKEIPAKINGDDILFCESKKTINKWKTNSSLMGLKPSIGKNYCSRHFGTINSQLVERRHTTFEVIPTGCFNCLIRDDQNMNTIPKALEVFPKKQVVINNKHSLVRTPQSIDIPSYFGGLGISIDRQPTDIDKWIYLFKLHGKHIEEIQTLDDKVLFRIPKTVFMKFKSIIPINQLNVPYDEQIFDKEDERDMAFPSREFKKFMKWGKTIPNIRNRINSMDLKTEVPLNLLTPMTVWIPIEYKTFLTNLRLRV